MTIATSKLEGFPAHKLAAARDALAKAHARLCRAAAKAGQAAPAAPSLTVLAERVTSRCRACKSTVEGFPPADHRCFSTNVDAYAGGSWITVELVDLEIAAERPVLAGWDFLACVEPLEGGNLIRQVPGAVVADGELAPWREGALRCDHCATVRRRTETFIVRADGSDVAIPAGTYKQVGRNCLEAFLGGKSAATIVAMLGWPEIVRNIAGDEDEGGGWFERAPSVVDPIAFLGWVCGVIREGGWVSRGAARDTGVRATADAALRLTLPPNLGDRDYAKDRERCAPGADGLERAAATLAWARDLSGATDYERNLALVARQPALKIEHTGILASAVTAYMRALGRELERKQRAARAAASPSKYVGAVGARLALDLLVERVVERSTEWGAYNILAMRDVDGNAFVWKTGSAGGTPGDRLRMTGTVKKHSEFSGEQQTEITRCTIAERILSGGDTSFAVLPSAPPAAKAKRTKRAAGKTFKQAVDEAVTGCLPCECRCEMRGMGCPDRQL